MAQEVTIHNANYTDDKGELWYFNTGKDNISGLSYPDHFIENKDKYLYTRLVEIRMSNDNTLRYPFQECFVLTAYGKDKQTISSAIVNVEGIISEGILKIADTRCKCIPLSEYDTNPNIIVSMQTIVENGSVVNVGGIWVESENYESMDVKVLKSIAFNSIPNNIPGKFVETSYESYYLDTESIVYDVNMYNLLESLGAIITRGKNINNTVIDKLKDLDRDVEKSIPAYAFLTVIYDDLFSPTEVNVDEIIKPKEFQYVEVGNSFGILDINRDGYLQVKEAGNYIVSLKVNMDIHAGNPAKMVMSAFLNDDRIEETTTTIYLNPDNKEYPLGFLSGMVQMELTPTDKLYLKARFSDINDVNIENHCTLQVTRLNVIS